MKILFCSEPLEPQLNRLVCRTEDDFPVEYVFFLLPEKFRSKKAKIYCSHLLSQCKPSHLPDLLVWGREAEREGERN